MIEFSNVSNADFDTAIRGMRNSWESHEKSDSGWQRELVEIGEYYAETKEVFVVGADDLKLMKKLIKAGSDHAKFMRQITLSLDINAPLYWWKEFDTYKVGTTANSESTMHTIQKKSFFDDYGLIKKDLFSLDETNIDGKFGSEIYDYVWLLENLREDFVLTKDKRYWRLLIQLLPSGWNQKRTVTLNYAVLANIYHSRKNHRLTEWHEMCDWIESLPYSEIITGGVE